MGIKKASEQAKNNNSQNVDLESKKEIINDFIQNADKTSTEKEITKNTKREFLSMTIRFNEAEAAALDKLKTKKGLTRIGVIRLAISEMLEKEFGETY
jgi:hypothetical protein